METSLFQSIVLAAVVGFASGAIGSFIILKRMALVGDALSHVALPGIAMALAWQIDPLWGVIAFLLAAAFIVWWLEGRTKLPTDALVGLLFTASLAIGVLTIPDHEIIESIFGGFPSLSLVGLALTIGLGVILAFLSFILARKFLFVVLSSDLGQVEGIGRGYSLILLVIFGSIVALGIKLVGTLLMGALTIIPASIAKNMISSMRSYMLVSAMLGGLIATIGVIIAHFFNLLPGPTIILIGVGLFGVTLLLKRS